MALSARDFGFSTHALSRLRERFPKVRQKLLTMRSKELQERYALELLRGSRRMDIPSDSLAKHVALYYSVAMPDFYLFANGDILFVGVSQVRSSIVTVMNKTIFLNSLVNVDGLEILERSRL